MPPLLFGKEEAVAEYRVLDDQPDLAWALTDLAAQLQGAGRLGEGADAWRGARDIYARLDAAEPGRYRVLLAQSAYRMASLLVAAGRRGRGSGPGRASGGAVPGARRGQPGPVRQRTGGRRQAPRHAGGPGLSGSAGPTVCQPEDCVITALSGFVALDSGGCGVQTSSRATALVSLANR